MIDLAQHALQLRRVLVLGAATDLAEADITYIDVGGREAPLTYPAGYFQLANPGEFEAITPVEETEKSAAPVLKNV